MLRGRCSCAISGRPGTPSGTQATRPTPSPAPRLLATSHSSLATALVSPIIPVHPGNSPVSPMIPVHTQKQGGGALKKLSATSDQPPGSKKNVAPSPASSGSPPATSHSPLSSIIPAPWATATLRVVPAPTFTTTSRIHCRRADNFPAARSRRPGPTQEGETQEPI